MMLFNSSEEPHHHQRKKSGIECFAQLKILDVRVTEEAAVMEVVCL